MNRNNPGIPPSRRRPAGWSEDWLRSHIISAARLAISSEPQPGLEIEPEHISEDGREYIVGMTAHVYRIILDGDGFDRRDDMAVESFMAVIQRALDAELGPKAA